MVSEGCVNWGALSWGVGGAMMMGLISNACWCWEDAGWLGCWFWVRSRGCGGEWGVWVVGDRGFCWVREVVMGGRGGGGCCCLYVWVGTAASFTFISVPTSLCGFARTDYAAGCSSA